MDTRNNFTIPFHYGTFAGFTQTPDEFITLTKNHSNTEIHIMNAGDTISCAELN